MADLFEIEALANDPKSMPRGAKLSSLNPRGFSDASELMRAEYDRRETARVSGLPERVARRVLKDVAAEGLLASARQMGAGLAPLPD